MSSKFFFEKSKIILVVLFMVSYLVSCRKDDVIAPMPASKPAKAYSDKPVVNYFGLLCTITKSTPGFFPPQAARAYGYVGLANYEAVVNGIDNAISLGGQLNGLSLSDLPKKNADLTYNWALASNAAIADMLRKMFAINITNANSRSIDSMETANYTTLARGEDIEEINRSVKFGKDVSLAIYNYSKTDGGQESYLDPFQLPYAMQVDSFCWVPTGAAMHPVSPNWGNNRPFLMTNILNTQPIAPPPFSIVPTSAFYKQAMTVYNQVQNNSPEEEEIAKYWADDPFNTCTPTGHTFNILAQLLEENKATLEKTSVGFAKLSIAENDAFISCWKGKYKYVLIRPVSYIKKYIAPSFRTVIGTPPFPAYTSGHSCEMGAGSRIFTNLFTDRSGNYQFTDYSQLRYGFQPRNYSNFTDMANECAASRFYGGLHYPMDNSKGLQVGRSIGDNVNYQINWPKNIQ